MVATIGVAGNVVLMAAAWLAAGAGSSFVWGGLNTLAVQSAPENRGGAISVVGAFKFSGNAVGPLLWLPLYLERPELAFATAGLACAAIAAVGITLRGDGRRVRVPASERARAAATAQQ